MSLIYIWTPRKTEEQAALHRFNSVLAEQCQALNREIRKEYFYRSVCIGRHMIGQIYYDLGLRECHPWLETERYIFAQTGVCEDLLQSKWSMQAIDSFCEKILTDPESIKDLTGRFSAFIVDQLNERVFIFNAATEAMTLWCTSGPNGWACGSRCLPLLKWVECAPRLNMRSAQLFLHFGHQWGKEGLFQGVERLSSRTAINLAPNQEPRIGRYLALEAYLSQSSDLLYSDVVRQSCDRLLKRMDRQVTHSKTLQLPLTGGRDSRLLAAALSRNRVMVDSFTSGPPTSPDVKIAAIVSNVLGFPHTCIFRPHTDLASREDIAETSFAWTRANECMEVLRYGFAFTFLFDKEEDCPAPVCLFHGLGSEIRRGYLYSKIEASELHKEGSFDQIIGLYEKQINPEILGSDDLKDYVRESVTELVGEMHGLGFSTAQWLDFLYWQDRSFHWGADMMSTKQVLNWRWTPLFDRQLIRLAWNLNYKSKQDPGMVDSMIKSLVPELEKVAYSSFQKYATKKGSWLSRSRRKLPYPLNRLASQLFVDEDQKWIRFWRKMILESEQSLYPSLLPKSVLLKTMHSTPHSDLLWGMASLEMFKDLCQ